MTEPFKYLSTIDISEILQVFKTKITENDWLEDTSRSETFDVHKDTHMLKILWDINFIGERHERNYSLFNFDKVIKNLTDVYKLHYKEGEVIRALFVRLKEHSQIPEHVDSGDSLETCHRTHIPIITNEENLFKVGPEVKNLKAGEVWVIDNTMTHAVRNMSGEPRIHLIVDYMEKDYD